MRLDIFDLDDTLVHYGRKKICVPRQTFHVLRALNQRIGVISFNALAHFVIAKTGLIKYVASVAAGEKPRAQLMQEVLASHPNQTWTELHYWDDREDNLQVVQTYFPLLLCIWFQILSVCGKISTKPYLTCKLKKHTHPSLVHENDWGAFVWSTAPFCFVAFGYTHTTQKKVFHSGTHVEDT